MKEIGIVRLESLRIRNLKNIEDGEIFFSEKKKVQRGDIDEDDFENVIGIYGQNGSGKTCTLNALRLIQAMLSGNPLLPVFNSYITIDKESCEVIADFLINIDKKYYYVVYDVEIEKAKSQMRIINEKLSFKDGNSTGKCDTFYKYSFTYGINKEFLFKLSEASQNIYQYNLKYDSHNIGNLYGLRSTIFNPKLYELVLKEKSNFGIYARILTALRVFGVSRLAIYSINYFNETSEVGIKFRYKEEAFEEDKRKIHLNCGDVFVPFEKFQLEKRKFATFSKTIENINKVLPSIIPDFTVIIDMTDDDRVLNQYNEESVSFILVGNRKGKRIPLQLESNGVKKIISILSGLIEAYTNEGCLIAVDEIDSGVFEYLLGEIVYAFDNFANGQLIFTSHNMRLLEKLNHKNIFFTTTDSNNVFVQLTNVKSNNNLRDLYYRYIANGDQAGHHFFDSVKTEDLIANMRVPSGDEYD